MASKRTLLVFLLAASLTGCSLFRRAPETPPQVQPEHFDNPVVELTIPKGVGLPVTPQPVTLEVAQQVVPKIAPPQTSKPRPSGSFLKSIGKRAEVVKTVEAGGYTYTSPKTIVVRTPVVKTETDRTGWYACAVVLILALIDFLRRLKKKS